MENHSDMNVRDILKRIKYALNVDKDKLISEKLGIPYPTLDTWKRRNKISEGKLREIAKKLNVDYEWLLNGKTVNTTSQTSPQVISIPYFPDTFVSAGGGAYNYSSAPKQITFTKDFLEEVLSVKSFEGLHLITAVGDSMEPSIEEGDKLLVLDYAKEGHAFIDGGVYVIAYASGVVVKRVYLRQDHIILHSDNPNISDEKLSGDDLEAAKVIGRVVGIVRKM